MDDREREKFYSAPNDEDDDGEYELEPPDEAVLKAEEARGKEAIETSRMAIDIDEIYRESDRELGTEIVESWFRDFKFKFRFQVKHLFIATAILAILFTLLHFQILGRALIILIMLAVCGTYLYIQWRETKQQQEAHRRREALFARRRAQMERKRAALGSDNADDEPAIGGGPPLVAAIPAADDNALSGSATTDTRFQFSLKQLVIAMTAAAIVLAFVRFMGGPDKAATMLGMMALLGLVLHAAGYNPPAVIVLGWWFVLVLYVIFSVVGAMWSLAA
jgi:hypothetical protein